MHLAANAPGLRPPQAIATRPRSRQGREDKPFLCLAQQHEAVIPFISLGPAEAGNVSCTLPTQVQKKDCRNEPRLIASRQMRHPTDRQCRFSAAPNTPRRLLLAAVSAAFLQSTEAF